MKPNSKILIIAGSDSSGGAGIQADIKTVTSLGSYAMTAVTAITVQNTNGVKSVTPIPANEIKNQNFQKLVYGLFILSVILEVLQFIIPNRSFQLGDLIGNILGVLVAFFVVKIYLLFRS